jgi:hypothetical protein
MPTDFTANPYAMQTDIVGTGGSSGSPIINLKNGKVIGIAQQVLESGVEINMIHRKNGKTEKLQAFGSSNLGLVYGISTRLFPTLPEDIQKCLYNRRPIQIHFQSCNLRRIGLKKSPNKPWLD